MRMQTEALTDEIVDAVCPPDLADGAEYSKEMECAVTQCESAIENWLGALNPAMQVGDALRELRLIFATR